MRVQDPTIMQTDGETPMYYIRPYIDTLDENGNMVREQKKIYLGRVGEISKRDAIRKKTEVMGKINKSQFTVQGSVRMGEFLDDFIKECVEVDSFAESSERNYKYWIEKVIRPAFGLMGVNEVESRGIKALLERMSVDGYGWSTRKHVLKILSKVFNVAEEWGVLTGKIPTKKISCGRKKMVYEEIKLTTEQLIVVLDAMPGDLRLVCELGLYGTLRVGEALGLQWNNVDFVNRVIKIRVQWVNGKLGQLKTEDSERDVPMGDLIEQLVKLFPGGDCGDMFVCSVRTRDGETRDANRIRNGLLVPIAKRVGVYKKGFGFHQFRREAITMMEKSMGDLQAQRMAGHSNINQTYKYCKGDMVEQEKAVRELQGKIRGKIVSIKEIA